MGGWGCVIIGQGCWVGVGDTDKQCQMWQVGGCTRCLACWGGFGAGNCIFWGSGV